MASSDQTISPKLMGLRQCGLHCIKTMWMVVSAYRVSVP